MITKMQAVVFFGAAMLVPAVAQAQSTPAFNWTGFYVGASLGYTAADINAGNILFEGVDYGVPSFSVSPDGVIGGVEGGFNWQNGSFVLGVEGDISWTSLDDSYTDSVNNFTGSGELNWLATVRGRVGFAMDRFMIFGTGGAAFGEIQATIDDVYNAGTITTKDFIPTSDGPWAAAASSPSPTTSRSRPRGSTTTSDRRGTPSTRADLRDGTRSPSTSTPRAGSAASEQTSASSGARRRRGYPLTSHLDRRRYRL